VIPRGIRNHNPGNLEASRIQWDGLQLVADMNLEQRNESRFCVFQAPHWGIRAMAKVLLRYYNHHGLKTVAGMIDRYAPSHENDSNSYADAVASALHVSRGTFFEMNWVNLDLMLRTMIKHENGEQPYSWEIPAGMVMAGMNPKVAIVDGFVNQGLDIKYK
jgi:hypothetical protein